MKLRNASDAKLQAVLFDWAGTTIDYGSREPAMVFVEVFDRQGVPITIPEARAPMGLAKRDHFAAILAMPRVAERWRVVHGAMPSPGDLERLFDEFMPLQKGLLAQHCNLIPGVVETVAACRARGLKIGSTTGYYRELMEIVLPRAAAAGYQPDVTVVPNDVPQGRPAPWLNLRAAERLGVYPMWTVVAVDDTRAGIDAGRNAGAWTVAVAKTGNSLGLSEEEVASLPADELAVRLHHIRNDFLIYGADFVVDSVAELLPVIDEINSRLESGERPT